MTTPSPFDVDETDYATLRRNFYGRYLSVQSDVDGQIRQALDRGATEASKRISVLSKSKEWEDQVRAAQLRIAKREMRFTLKDVFDGITPFIKIGQQKAARAASDAITSRDKNYLRAVFSSSGEVDSYIRSQQAQAMLQVGNAISRITKSRQSLSERVYNTRALSSRWIDNILTTSIMRGDSAQEIAGAVRKHIRPNTPGGVSYAAMRLARTEVNNAFHATTITLSQDRPWIESMAWNLSATHKNDTGRMEICEVYAARVFHVDSVPSKPHPQCRCFVTPKLEAYESFIRHLTAGQYRDWISNAA